MSTETYEVNMICNNCGAQYKKKFPKKQNCRGSWTCDNCGCMEARSVGQK